MYYRAFFNALLRIIGIISALSLIAIGIYSYLSEIGLPLVILIMLLGSLVLFNQIVSIVHNLKYGRYWWR